MEPAQDPLAAPEKMPKQDFFMTVVKNDEFLDELNEAPRAVQ
jgi:hypothetical protein